MGKSSKDETNGPEGQWDIPSRVEHIFGVQAQRAGTLLIRTIGKIRATTKIGLRNLAFNIDRYCMLATT